MSTEDLGLGRPLNVVIYTTQFDTGGQGWKLKRALERYAPDEFNVRDIRHFDSYFGYPRDLKYDPQTAYDLFAEADVIHMRNGLEGLSRLLSKRDPAKAPPGLIVHHHGTRFREWHRSLSQDARDRNAVQIASTVDLAMLEPDVEWLPAPFDLSELASYRPLERANGPIRIAHAPTNRKVKQTDRIMLAIAHLHRAGYDIVFDLIENEPWDETLRRKGKADIVVDQLELGIGNNALEAFGMSIPVISGISNHAVWAEMHRQWGRLPFFEASKDNLEEKLSYLIHNKELREQIGSEGFEYLMTYHDESKVAARLAAIYNVAIEKATSLAQGVA